MRSTERNTTPSMISRVSEILKVYQHDERFMSLSEISRRTGIPKASASRIVAEMVDYGLLERQGDQIQLGLRLFELGQQASRHTDLRKFAYPAMSELSKATGQTVHLAVLEGTEVVYIHILRSKSAPPLPSRVGGRLPAYATGVGKALLAYAPESIFRDLPEEPMPALGPRTVTNREQLKNELKAIRENRVAFEREESASNVGCAAAPIVTSDGKAVAAISVSVHLHLTDLNKMGPAVATAAMALSRDVGRLNYTAWALERRKHV